MSVWSIELRKACGNRWFALTLLVGSALAMISAVGNIGIALNHVDVTTTYAYVEDNDPELSARTLYRFIMLTDYIQLGTDLFYTVLPLLAVLPYGWSLAQERRNGYVSNAYVRVSRVRYLAAKAIAALAAGACAVGIPLVLNCVVCACFIPAYPTSVETVFMTGIYDTVMWSELYYTGPLLFTLSYLVLSMCFCGLWSALVVLLGFVFADGIRLVVGSSLALYLFGALERDIAVATTGSSLEYVTGSPLLFMRGVATDGVTCDAAAFAWLVGLALACVFAVLLAARGDVL